MDAAGVKFDSHNLRDLLRIRDEDFQNNPNHASSSGAGGGGSGSEGRSSRSHGLTLLAVLADKGGPSPPRRSIVESARTLLDVISEDQIGGGRRDGRRSWRQLKDKIRLRHRDRNNNRMLLMARRPGGSARFSSVAHNGESSHSVIPNVRVPNLRANSSGETGRTGPPLDPGSQLPSRPSVVEVIDDRAAEQPVRMSLMALLEESDLQLGWEDSTRAIFDDGVEIDEEPENVVGGASASYNNCCVCMVRHKGAAFIPCGHTFCRLCSRELWVQRGNCPLCNNYILEILDIF